MSLSNPLKVKKKFCQICLTVYQEENQKVSIFTVPKNKLSSWQLLIPGLKQTSSLCEKHFDPSDIVKGFSDGHVFHPFERSRLRPSAVPKHFLGNNMYAIVNQSCHSKQSIKRFMLIRSNVCEGKKYLCV